MWEAVALACLALLPFVLAAYGAPSRLWLGDKTLWSGEGVQQGDPLGPLLFCLTIHPLLSEGGCDIVTGYLDDIGLGDQVPRLVERIQALEVQASAMGLSLNHDKCEVIGLGPSELVQWQSSGLRFAVTNTRDASFLGAPLGKEGVDAALLANGELLEVIKPRLARMAAHEAFFC